MSCDNLGENLCCPGPCAKMLGLGRDPVLDPRAGDVWEVTKTSYGEKYTVEVTIKKFTYSKEVYFHYPGWCGDEWHAPHRNQGWSSFPLWSDVARRDGWRFLRNDPARTGWQLNPYGGWGAYPVFIRAEV